MTDIKLSSDAGNLEIALAYAASGLPIFPAACTFNERKKKWDKVPLVEWRKEATKDEATLRAWWQKWPSAVPGIELEGAGLVVVDADRHGGPDGVANLAALVTANLKLADHPTAQTAGNGEHHYFKQWKGETFRNSEGKVAPGVDIRGAGGWIVAPGAWRPDRKRWGWAGLAKAYRDNAIPILPDWIAAKTRQPKAKPDAPKPNGANNAHHAIGGADAKPRPAWSQAEEARVRAALACIPADARAVWLRIGAALHWTGWDKAREIWDAWSQTEPGAFDIEGQDKAWTSFDREFNGTPVTLATVFSLAIDNGYKFDEASEPELQSNATGKATPGPNPFTPIWLSDIKVSDDPACIVDGIIPAGPSFGLIPAAPKSLKSFFLADLLIHGSIGKPYGGRAVQQGIGVYITSEGIRGVERRLMAMRWYHKAEDAPFALIPVMPNLGTGTADLELLIAAIADAAECLNSNRKLRGLNDLPVHMIGIDTLRKATPGKDENSAKDLSVFLTNGETLSRRFKCFVGAVHHSPRAEEGRGSGTNATDATADVILLVKRDGKATRATVTVGNMKDGEEGDTWTFELTNREVGTDRNNNPLFGAYVVITEPPAAGRAACPQKRKPTPTSAKFLEAFHNAPTVMLNGRQCVTRDAWMQECKVLGLLNPDEAAGRSLMSRHRRELVERNWIACHDDHSWKL